MALAHDNFQEAGATGLFFKPAKNADLSQAQIAHLATRDQSGLDRLSA